MRLLRERALLVGLPLGIATVGVVEAVLTPGSPTVPAAVLAVLAAAALLLRYRHPAAAAVLTVSSIPVQVAVGVDLADVMAPILVLGLAAYGLGARLPLRTALPVALALVAMVWLSEVLAIGVRDSNPLFGMVLTFGTLSMGRVLQTRHAALESAAAAEREVAVSQERARIARELHDLIAHTVSVMVVQASAAEQVLRTDPDRAQTALGEVQRAGREALSETALLLDLLREGPDDAAPQPGIAELPAIVARTPGLDVELRVDEPLPRLPPGAEVSLCRIVQESLTNVLKHSASSRASVHVVGSGDAVLVRVEDPGPPRRSEPLAGGHGLLGMRERVEVYGGALTAGPARRGWSVEARIPAEAPA